MEALSNTSQQEINQRPSASELIKASQHRAEQNLTPELTAEPTQTEYTIEDYVDSMEAVKNARRYLAKSYERYELNQVAAEGVGAVVPDRADISRQRPNWGEHFPRDDSDEERARWEEFVLSYNDTVLQDSLRYLEETSKKHQEIRNRPELKNEIDQYGSEKLQMMAEVAAYRHIEREEAAIILQIEKLNADAILKGEAEYTNKGVIENLQRRLMVDQEARNSLLHSPGAMEELGRRRALDSKRQLDSGILMTNQMEDVARKSTSSLLRGEPLLLVGETGGAKTALARELGQRILDRTGKAEKRPEIISGFGEINTYQLMGKNELRTSGGPSAEGSTITEFAPGPLVRAMQEGRPVILDEVNAMPAEIIKRLNIIMQLRPGDTYKIQENNGMEITVQSGFCIVATMNEKSHRYRGVEELSSEFKDRFGVNIGRIKYPDQDTAPGGDSMPEDLLNLAMAVCTEDNGKVAVRNMSVQELASLVRVAHFTQMLYTHPANDAGLGNYADENRVAEAGTGATALSKTVISPRTMVQIIEKVQQGGGSVKIQDALADFTDRIEDAVDKKTIIKLLEDYSLLPVQERK